MGYHLARRLSLEKKDVTLIDKSEQRMFLVQENLDVRTIYGRGSSPSVLLQAGIATASMLVAVTDSDEANLVACYVGRMLNGMMKKVARLRGDDYSAIPQILDDKHLGIDLVISPEREAVAKLGQILQVPGATDVVDFAEQRIKLFGIRLQPDSALVGRSLEQIRSSYPHEKFLIPAVFRESEIIIPRGEDVLRPHDTVYIIAGADHIPRLLEICGLRSRPLKRFMVYGTNNVAVRFVRSLEEQGVTNIRLIGSDDDACERVAAELRHTLVLKSDALDEEFLRSEGITETDVFLAMTDDDEQNALSAILAKRMGSYRVAALTNKAEYHRLVSAIGVDIAVNPRLVGVARILQFIRRGKVLSVSMLPGDAVEILECEAMETSDIVGRPINKLKFPRGAIVGAIERGTEFIIPDGSTVIIPGDRVIIFSRREAVPKIERLLTVKLDYFE
jgi:trk system potassium uptake protein TrkA